MKIAILGGSFDPPHLGHILIATQVREILKMDEVWLMPLYQKEMQDEIFHKKLTPVNDRLAMTHTLKNEFIKISQFEILHNQTSFTYDTLEELEKQHPNDTFYWILGSDQLNEFQKYHKWNDLVKTKNLIIFPREHTLWHLEEKVKESLQVQEIPENVIVLQNRELILTNISSSTIRKRVKKRLQISFLVPAAVNEYIKNNELYV
jgi:nicotinate-nucleotide adenylyltransferase